MYIFKLFIFYFIVISTWLNASNYTLSLEKELYVPIVMDDITMMMSLRPSEVLSPTNGSTIKGNLSMKFSKGSGVEKRLLKVYYANHTKQAVSTWLTSDSYAVSLPKDGKYVDVELRSYITDKYFIKKYRFKQSTNPSLIISHANGAYLDSSAITLRWSTGINVTKRYMYIGTSGHGSKDVFQGYLTGNSKTIYNLPKNGETIYVTFLSMIDGKWNYRYYTYTATDVKRIAQEFVKAYLANSATNMRKIAPQRVIDKLKTKHSTVRNYFSKIRTYYKLLYFHDYKAMVIGKTSDNKEIKFYFAWDGAQWVLESVI